MKSLAGSPACVPITFFTAQLACSLESAGPFCGLAFRLCPCKAQGCVGCRQHSLSAGGLRPLASPESRGRKRGSLSLPGSLRCPEPIPEAGGSPAPGTGTCVRNGNRHISFCRGTQKFPAWKKMLSFSRKKSSLSRFPPEYLKVNKEKAIILKITLDGSCSHCYHFIRFAQKAPTIQNTHSDRRLLDISHREMKQKYGENPGSNKYLYTTLNGDGLVRAQVTARGPGSSLPPSHTFRLTSILLIASEKDLEKRIEETIFEDRGSRQKRGEFHPARQCQAQKIRSVRKRISENKEEC